MTEIVALHGFLGRPDDWKGIGLDSFPLIAPDLYQPMHDLGEWAKEFNLSQPDGRVLMGYSLGGRLALHALIQNPTKWKGAIIISAHPGLTDEEEKRKRLKDDQTWASKFLHDEWDEVTAQWNRRPVFEGSSSTFKRGEKDYDRKVLSNFLVQTSLGRQDDLRSKIAQLPIPLLWVTGEKDPKFSTLASSVRLSHPESRKIGIPQAGHRVPWDQPLSFLEALSKYLRPR